MSVEEQSEQRVLRGRERIREREWGGKGAEGGKFRSSVIKAEGEGVVGVVGVGGDDILF